MISMQQEIDAHSSNKSWSLVPRPLFIPSNARVWQGVNPENGKKAFLVPGVWRYHLKTGKNGKLTNMKSCWCADGSRIKIENEHMFVSIARPTTIQMIASLATYHRAMLSSGDVPSAYVKSLIPKEVEVYMHQPTGFVDSKQESDLCLLSKALYGLPFAGKCWNCDLCKFLVSIGFTQSPINPGVSRID
jgi:hypothetical protein